MPTRLPPDADAATTRSEDNAASERLHRQLRDALAAGRLLQALQILRQAKNNHAKTARPTVHAPKSGGAQRGHRPGGLSPGEMPRRRFGPGLAASTVALLAIAAWWLLSNG